MEMFNLNAKNSFKRDAKKHLDLFFTAEWLEVINCLVNRNPMPDKYCDHQLKGELKAFRECHVRPDLLLVYSVNEKLKQIELIRLASHSELF